MAPIAQGQVEVPLPCLKSLSDPMPSLPLYSFWLFCRGLLLWYLSYQRYKDAPDTADWVRINTWTTAIQGKAWSFHDSIGKRDGFLPAKVQRRFHGGGGSKLGSEGWQNKDRWKQSYLWMKGKGMIKGINQDKRSRVYSWIPQFTSITGCVEGWGRVNLERWMRVSIGFGCQDEETIHHICIVKQWGF